eukprot:79979-Ditylum_brightwellii.AAC.1
MPNNPQAAFAGYTCSLQFKWAYIQRTIKVEEQVYESVEDVINIALLPALFDACAIPTDLRNLTSIPAQMGGLGALHPCPEAPDNLATLQDSTSHIVDTILGQVTFDTQEHAATMETGRAGGKRRRMSCTHEFSLNFKLSTL